MPDETPIASFTTTSQKETQRLGYLLGELLEGGEVIGLIGDLGAGKTCFVKGLAMGLDISQEEITSPTFTLIHEHTGRQNLAHVDLFRLEKIEAIEALGLVDYFVEDWVTVIEWGERALPFLPSEKMLIRFLIPSSEERTLRVEPMGETYLRLTGRWVGKDQETLKKESDA
ncbi:MAG TPA: tRNA (adenosine(37)-N6)-threonylcarbamoyltransferase complex ATPase subunit type 1 TsaE [Nitrospiria bacterium]|jgi:tRNA threonylcarbamoyladenosine biosynthesis protein TsaE